MVRLGLARADATPPTGSYHRVWGAARHDRSTGVHRPLWADVIAFAPLGGERPAWLRVQLDLVGFTVAQHQSLQTALAAAAGVPPDHVVITYSHTHASGRFEPDRVALPGGELLPAYLERLWSDVAEAARQAVAGMQDVCITYGTGRCALAVNRDYWDESHGLFVCGFNPDTPADDTLIVARVSDRSGRLVTTIVHYGCHPTTLAWENTLISPDYIGPMREEVERILGAPCVPLQGASGDLAPRDGYTGDTAVADRNGRQLAYAALSALQALDPPATDFVYRGPVISGATLGAWAHVPFSPERTAEAARFASAAHRVDLPMKPKPTRAELEARIAHWTATQAEADRRGDPVAARDAGARAERARRWLSYVDDMPAGETYPLQFYVHRMGDAIWVACGGEPYSLLQTELRRRFPGQMLLVSPLAGDFTVAYLMPADRYGIGLYQEEPSTLGRGCLEILIEAISRRIQETR
jgi:hypothetical protein